MFFLFSDNAENQINDGQQNCINQNWNKKGWKHIAEWQSIIDRFESVKYWKLLKPKDHIQNKKENKKKSG